MPIKDNFEKRNFGNNSVFFNQYKDKTRQVLSTKGGGSITERSKSEKRNGSDEAVLADHANVNETAVFNTHSNDEEERNQLLNAN